MAKVDFKSQLTIDIKFNLQLSLAEARALKQIVGWDCKTFLDAIYSTLGKSYVQPHEAGMESLFKTLKETLPHELHDADKLIAAINDVKGLNSQYRAAQEK